MVSDENGPADRVRTQGLSQVLPEFIRRLEGLRPPQWFDEEVPSNVFGVTFDHLVRTSGKTR